MINDARNPSRAARWPASSSLEHGRWHRFRTAKTSHRLRTAQLAPDNYIELRLLHISDIKGTAMAHDGPVENLRTHVAKRSIIVFTQGAGGRRSGRLRVICDRDLFVIGLNEGCAKLQHLFMMN